RIARDLVEIDDAVESPAGADPVVDRLAHLLGLFIVIIGAQSSHRGAVDFHAVFSRGFGDLPQALLDLLRVDFVLRAGEAALAANIVAALEKDQVTRAALREYVAIDP